MGKRPIGVTIIAILSAIGEVFDILGGLSMMSVARSLDTIA